MRPFRFGYQLRADDAATVRSEAAAAEACGFDVLCSFDHLGPLQPALMPLAIAADITKRIRLCPLVLNNDLRHPAVLAQELASLDQLSDGRLEVGIGAGHSFTEYQAAGLVFDPPAVRKARLAESVEILRRLLDGEAVSHDGDFYNLHEVTTIRPAQGHVPLLIGVNGRTALAHAARHADMIGLTMLGRTLPDGQHHEVRWDAGRLTSTVEWIRANAGARADQLELNALVQVVCVTDDRSAAAEELARAIPGLSAADALTTPFVALGDHEQICEHLLTCRERWGITYYVVRELDAFAPVIEHLREIDRHSR